MAVYKRIMLKLSGEALGGNGELFDFTKVRETAEIIRKMHETGVEIGIVIGAGNIWRGRQGTEMDRTLADRMGMLATVINSIYLKDAIIRAGAEAVVMTAVPMEPVADAYSAEAAVAHLEAGRIVIFGAGLGIPFLSTDTTGAVRAAEIGADAMFMAKNIDYIYTADPRIDPTAKKLERVKASEVLAMNLKALDATATAFCLSTGMPIHVFGLKNPEDILKAIEGECVGTVVTAE
jgi:uridylate kinase